MSETNDKDNPNPQSDDASTAADTPPAADEPIQPTLPGRIAAIVVLFLMASAIGYVIWTVIRYWDQVAV